ncbi:hypothetical protein BDW42DRAFT_158013 [Aspergillus taichungensis]|uniref:Rhodopsin domain-containing protein n=1 Tax=Aspergillus taichungensis TaxID=482145 RepID=A0A2J5IAI7_9EURO|nr:hypothetical protein BDW42DRAFT_158013 [Aspergillus taichungensis]
MTYENAKDELNTVNLVTQCLCIVICSIFVILRFGIRIWYKQFVWVEDTACLLTWLLFMGYCGVSIVTGKYGGGYHITDVPLNDQTLFRKFGYIATVLYCPMALLCKVALLSILTRIFTPFKSKVIFIYSFLGCLCVYYVIALVIKIRMCDPVPGYWDLNIKAQCLDQRAALVADSVISVVSDLIILILPLPMTWSLQMSRNKKLRVTGMLSAGGLATAFSIYRLVLVLKEGNSPDQTMVFTCVILSGNAEGGVGLICACLPTLNILMSKLRKAAYSSGHYYKQDSSVPLSKVKGAGKGTFSAVASKHYPEPHEYASDQSHLISYAGAVSTGSAGHDGIHKTVDVSQTVEVMQDHSPPRNGHL